MRRVLVVMDQMNVIDLPLKVNGLKVKELVLKNASLAVSGVYPAAADGVLNPQTIQITPGAIIPVARNGGAQGE